MGWPAWTTMNKKKISVMYIYIYNQKEWKNEHMNESISKYINKRINTYILYQNTYQLEPLRNAMISSIPQWPACAKIFFGDGNGCCDYDYDCDLDRGTVAVEVELYISHILHGTGIVRYICTKFMVNVAKYSSPMAHLGFIDHFGLKEMFLDLAIFLDHFELWIV